VETKVLEVAKAVFKKIIISSTYGQAPPKKRSVYGRTGLDLEITARQDTDVPNP
jgi:hypothetical protein